MKAIINHKGFLIFLVTIWQLEAVPSPWSSNVPVINFPCTSYCKYNINSNNNLRPDCSQALAYSANGGCTDCDALLFTLQQGFCIHHLYNSQTVMAYYNYHYGVNIPLSGSGTHNLGYVVNDGTINYKLFESVAISKPHYATRIRFSAYFYNNIVSNYYYPLGYAMDTQAYTYNQLNTNYFSQHVIITSPLLNHTAGILNVSFTNLNLSMPNNNDGSAYYGSCCCYSCVAFSGCCSCGCAGYTCCDLRYIQIRDLIVFASVCPTNCSSCISATQCFNCTGTNVLNYADKLCYSSCPQSTYLNITMYQVGDTISFSTYLQVNQSYCVPCPAYNISCMECTNQTVCTRCFTTGRNQSYLFNNTCVPNPCPNGFVANMTNHTCDCPILYHYSNITANNSFMWCYTCSFQCVQCFGQTNLNCTVCQVGFYLANGTTFCLNECPSGEFLNPSTQTCYLCDISCSTCIDTSTTCTQCFTNAVRYLLGTVCLSWCPNGYSWNNITRTCDLCNFYTYSYLGACVTLCPSMYQANVANRSCIPYSQTNFQFALVLQKVQILSHGKLLQYTILAQDGLDNASLSWIKYKSYNYVTVIYGNSQLKNFVGIRSLQSSTLPIRNLNYANNRITYTTNLPNSLDYHKSFQISFATTLYSQQGIMYNNLTNGYSIIQHPQLMSQYFNYSVQNNFNIIMIPFLAIIFLIFQLRIKGTYEMYIQTFRIVQTLGLLVYSFYPIGVYSYFFLVGCNYCNFEFVPNLYDMIVDPDKQMNFTSYYLTTPDMDFIRLMGSVILVGIIILILYLIFRNILLTEQQDFQFLLKLGIDLMEVKIFHSFWSSFLYIVSNYQTSNFGMYMIFIFAIIFLLGILARRYSIWKQTQDVSPFFIWRAISTLLVCFTAMANEIVISILIMMSLCITLWQFFILHSNKYLININDINSSNYMDQKTYKILNSYDVRVQYSFSIPMRNTIITLCPVITAFLSAILILLQDSQQYSILFTTIIVYIISLLVIIITYFIYQFIIERRKFLVQNKLEYLQNKYSNIFNADTQVFQPQKNQKFPIYSLNFDQMKLQNNVEIVNKQAHKQIANRQMIKNL